MNSEEVDMEALAKQLHDILDIADRKYHFRTYQSCFVGTDAIKAMVENGFAATPTDAIELGKALLAEGVIAHVTGDHDFKDQKLFYRFASDNPESHGEKAVVDGKAVSWAQFLIPSSDVAASNLQAKNRTDRGEGADMAADLASEDALAAIEKLEIFPLDENNVTLLDNTHPKEWIEPPPQKKYNLVVIGAGAGGLVSSIASVGVGAKVALIEQNLMGGDCLNVGCVPSKALLKSAKVLHTLRKAAEFGVDLDGEVRVNFPRVMQRLRRIRASISPNDSAERYAKAGVDVFLGHGMFLDSHTVQVNDKELKFSKAVIATGATAAIPAIPGLEQAPYYTNSTVFNLTELPPRVAVIGTGPIGCELGQCFARFGSEVTMLNRSNRMLGREDPEATAIVRKSMEADGVTFKMGLEFTQVVTKAPAAPSEGRPFAIVSIEYTKQGVSESVEVEALIIATGRKPNVAGLGLENAGVKFSRQGVLVDDNLRTSVGHIFAVGDICCSYKFTHVADFMARMVVRNALFFGRDKFSSLLIPWATYTEPEIAHVGLYEADLVERQIPFDVYQKHMDDVDRAICDSDTEGFVKILTKKGTDEIMGATIVASGAGDMISEVTLAMSSKTGLGKLAYTIHPYPTQAEAVRQCGDLFNRTRLTPFIKSIFRHLMSAQR